MPVNLRCCSDIDVAHQKILTISKNSLSRSCAAYDVTACWVTVVASHRHHEVTMFWILV